MLVNVWDWKNNHIVATNKISVSVKAISFSEDGDKFVTVGNRHVKFWYLEYNDIASKNSKFESFPLMGRNAILGDQRSNYFCDVACGRGDTRESTFAITKSGLLCEFNNRRLLNKWVELKVRLLTWFCILPLLISFFSLLDWIYKLFVVQWAIHLRWMCTGCNPLLQAT